jgi:hypothetical protein
MTVKELEHQIRTLTFAEKAQILQFLLQDFTAFIGSTRPANGMSKSTEQNQFTLQTTEFDRLAEQLMLAFSNLVGQRVPVLSDYSISRAGIYEEHA